MQYMIYMYVYETKVRDATKLTIRSYYVTGEILLFIENNYLLREDTKKYFQTNLPDNLNFTEFFAVISIFIVDNDNYNYSYSRLREDTESISVFIYSSLLITRAKVCLK